MTRFNNDDKPCYGDASFTFKQLKLMNISSYDLYRWNAPIDTINDYQKYFIENDMSFMNRYFCNCSANWFGITCQYSFVPSEEGMTFDEIIVSQFKNKEPLKEYSHIHKESAMLTCYEGLQCYSVICLDWREICDGFINCEHGEDEPEECLLLEINECNIDEYRCQFGMCVPKTFLIDFSYDCMDLSDESEEYRSININYDCYSTSTLQCDFSVCKSGALSCGDGQCEDYIGFLPICNNGRDLFFRQNLLSTFYGNDKSHNISFACWSFMICIFEEDISRFIEYFCMECECTMYIRSEKECLMYFRKYCPESFRIQTHNNFLYSFVQFFYQNISTKSFEWWLPSHVCYISEYCPTFPFAGLPLIDGLMCIESKIIEVWDEENLFSLKLLFSSCRTFNTLTSTHDTQLFYCNKSMKFISKHRLYDYFKDCYYMEDESVQVPIATIHTLNLTNHFKCMTIDQWIPRPLIGKIHCRDRSDEIYIGDCKISSDIGCQFRRDFLIPSVHYIFRENCNSIDKLGSFIGNETDETSCEEWSTNRCDDYWDVYNGEDELNCTNTIPFYIAQIVLKCNTDEHYCVYPNGTIGCLSKERAGDRFVDCLGGTDERELIELLCHPLSTGKGFWCSGFECLTYSHLCDRRYDCSEVNEEIVCPWVFNFTCKRPNFTCKNGTCINYLQRCNRVIDCQLDGEDEWLCDIDYQKTLQFSLNNIDRYPPTISDSLPLAITTSVHSSIPLLDNTIIYKNDNHFTNWFCNRGVIVINRSLNIECLCPPSYYGVRCEYQSERILITVRIHTPIILHGYQNQQKVVRLVARLIRDNIVYAQEDILHVPLMKQIFYLKYPRPPPKQRGNWSVRLDAYLVTMFKIDYKASWLFDVPFSFLPFNRLVLHLMLKDGDSCNTLSCVHGTCKKFLNAPHHEYCLCEENWVGKYCNITQTCSCAVGGKCIDTYPNSSCICPLGHMGNDCQALFDPCNNIKCQHDGMCIPLDERQSSQFSCLCPNGYYGILCELIVAQIDIHFSKSISSLNHGSSAAVFIHFLELEDRSPGIFFVQNRLLYKQLQLNKPLRVYNTNHEYLSSFIVLQIFFQPDFFDYYIAAIIKTKITNVSTKIQKSNRCPHVDELILNETIRGFSSIKKVKYYHYACEMSNTITCFHDEAFLCFCDRFCQPDCVFFRRESIECTTNYCKNDGRCVQNNFNGVWDFGCVCSECTYGSLCQIVMSQYAFSLDAMLGQEILQNVSIVDQPLMIKLALIIFIMMISLGFISNSLSLITFKQPIVREFGCGWYLFCLPIIGQLGLSVFAGRFFYFLSTQNITLIINWLLVGVVSVWNI